MPCASCTVTSTSPIKPVRAVVTILEVTGSVDFVTTDQSTSVPTPSARLTSTNCQLPFQFAPTAFALASNVIGLSPAGLNEPA